MSQTSPAALPDPLWIFASRQLYLTKHNLTITRQLTSASVAQFPRSGETELDPDPDWLPLIDNPHKANAAISPFTMSLLGRYWNEMNGESVRRQFYRHAPSRVASLFAFGDQATCQLVAQRYHWDLSEVCQFRPVAIRNWGRFNMSIISIMNETARRQNSPVGQELWHAYWASTPATYEIPAGTLNNDRITLTSEPAIYEYLIDGVIELV